MNKQSGVTPVIIVGVLTGALLLVAFVLRGKTTTSVPQPPTTANTQSSQANNSLQPTANCDGTPTPSQTEGPYYIAGSLNRNNITGSNTDLPEPQLTVKGFVFDKNCQPVTHAWLDFWQADANGKYDNVGYKLNNQQAYLYRGHQFTDEKGQYILYTVIPGEYPGRTAHIHVKVRKETGPILTTQLYIPGSARNESDNIYNPALLVSLSEDRKTATYNFVLPE